mgnify:CR=1 FL=1
MERVKNTGMYQCQTCHLIPSNQDLTHKYVSNPRLQAFDRCKRCGGKHAWAPEQMIPTLWTDELA